MKINLNTKYFYIINDDLKMSKGKIAAQVSHVAMQISSRYHEIGRAIILKTTEEEIKNLMTNPHLQPVFCIEDAGLTEVPKGSLTCIGFKETKSSSMITDKLKLV